MVYGKFTVSTVKKKHLPCLPCLRAVSTVEKFRKSCAAQASGYSSCYPRTLGGSSRAAGTCSTKKASSLLSTPHACAANQQLPPSGVQDPCSRSPANLTRGAVATQAASKCLPSQQVTALIL